MYNPLPRAEGLLGYHSLILLVSYAALIVVVVLFAPHGLVGELDRRLVRRRYARSARG